MSFRWLSASSLLLLIACGGESTSDPLGAGGAGAQAGSSGSGGGSTGGATNGGSGGSGAVYGGTGGIGTGATGGVAAGGAPSGGGGAPCTALADGYQQALSSAKVCNPYIDMNECTQPMPDQLPCPCGNTFVNPSNTQALTTLKELQAQWNAQGCYEGIACPDIACQEPSFGSCAPSPVGTYGNCEDLFENSGG
jgi:hypothetical protein